MREGSGACQFIISKGSLPLALLRSWAIKAYFAEEEDEGRTPGVSYKGSDHSCSDHGNVDHGLCPRERRIHV